jgi:TolB-like protein/tRNA A-37 threonylcarbamoyl transferase component Bud32
VSTSPQASPPGCSQCGRPLAATLSTGLCVTCVTGRWREQLTPGPAAAETARLPPGFEFIDVLGHGGMGEVFLAFQTSLARYVALKRASAHRLRDPRTEERFLREARAAARLSHPGIVPILEVGRLEAQVWFTMEYVEGGDLAQLLERRGGRLPWPEAVALVIPVAEAIQHAHAAGIAHRDLKPSNILLDASGAPKVTDFGLAWLATREAAELTATDEVLGTPAYLPPETLSAARHTTDPRRGDLYSLGALLFHLAGGRPPFTGEHPAALLSAIATTSAPRLSSATEAVIPADLDEICARCLAKNPAQRFESAGQLVQALRACRPGAGSWFTRRRSRPRVVAALLVTAAALAGAGAWVVHQVTKPEPALGRTGNPVIAVTTLDAVSDDAATRLLADGLQDELIGTLMRITDVNVIASRSVRALNKNEHDLNSAREALGAELVLTGKIRKWDGKIWASVQLTNTSDGTARWSQTYITNETNVLNLQTDIATAIALRLRRTLRPAPPDLRRGASTREPEAQAQLDRARTLMNDASASVAFLEEAELLLTSAVKKDPSFVLAYTQLAQLHTQMYNWGNDRTDRRLALGLEAAQQALRLNPDLPEGEIALGNYYLRGSRDYVTAGLHFWRALALTPNNPDALQALAHLERRQGDFVKAGLRFEAALRLDPLNAMLAYNTADTYLRMRDYERASAILNRSLSLIPNHVALLKLRGDLYVAWKGDVGPMRDDIERRDPKLPTPWLYLMDRIDCRILEHRIAGALADLRASEFTELRGQSIYLNRDGYEALLLELDGRNKLARVPARRALEQVEQLLKNDPHDARVLLLAGQMQAILGQVAEGQRRVQRVLTPGDLAQVDAFDRGIYLRSLAVMLANVGADADAEDTLRLLLAEPNQTSDLFISLHPALSRLNTKKR